MLRQEDMTLFSSYSRWLATLRKIGPAFPSSSPTSTHPGLLETWATSTSEPSRTTIALVRTSKATQLALKLSFQEKFPPKTVKLPHLIQLSVTLIPTTRLRSRSYPRRPCQRVVLVWLGWPSLAGTSLEQRARSCTNLQLITPAHRIKWPSRRRSPVNSMDTFKLRTKTWTKNTSQARKSL